MSSFKMAFLAIAAPIGACATRIYDAPALVPTGYNFAYETAHRETVGLVQAFDDGAKTYLQFNETPLALRILSDGARELPFHRNLPYVTIDGIYERLDLSVDMSSVVIVNQVGEASRVQEPVPSPSQITTPLDDQAHAITAASTRARVAAVGVPEALQTMPSTLRVNELNRDVSRLQERIEAFSVRLDQAHQAGAALNVYLRDSGGIARLIVQFDEDSANPRVDADLLALLGAAGRAANRLYLHAHTDAFVASDTGTDLAIRRAVAVKQLLLAQQVSPGRVRLFYRGAGNFIANNATAEGKGKNRRVEIEFRRW